MEREETISDDKELRIFLVCASHHQVLSWPIPMQFPIYNIMIPRRAPKLQRLLSFIPRKEGKDTNMSSIQFCIL
eukprot:scaffold2249_cov86-Cylindrotheca_fusiformis.AAC.7